MSWWDDLNRLKDEAIESINNVSTQTVGQIFGVPAAPVSATTQIATTPNTAKPVSGTNTAAAGGALGVNNNLLIVGVVALIAALYLMKK